MGRFKDEEDAYKSACGTVFKLPLFPVNLNLEKSSPSISSAAVVIAETTLLPTTTEKNDKLINEMKLIRYKPEFILLSKVSAGVRIQRLLFLNELKNINKKIQDLKILDTKCDEKKKFIKKQLLILESELQIVLEDDKSTCKNPFNAFMNLNTGKNFFVSFLLSIYDNFQNEIVGDDKVCLSENVGNSDEVNEKSKNDNILIKKLMNKIGCMQDSAKLSIDNFTDVWSLFVLWSTVRAIELRYKEIIKMKKKEKKMKKNRPDVISNITVTEKPEENFISEKIEDINDNSYVDNGHDDYDDIYANPNNYTINEKLDQISLLKERKGYFDWPEVCRFLKIKNSDILSEDPQNMNENENEKKKDFNIVMKGLLYKFEKNHICSKMINTSIINDMKNELHSNNFLSQKLISLFVNITDILASNIYGLISDSLRESVLWIDVLEEIRIERMKKTNEDSSVAVMKSGEGNF